MWWLCAAKVIRLIGQVLHTVVVELVDLQNNYCLAMKNFTLSNRLQEARYNSEEAFKKVYVFISTIGLRQRELWWWASVHCCMASWSIMHEKKLLWSITCICIRKWDLWLATVLDMNKRWFDSLNRYIFLWLAVCFSNKNI